MNDEDETNEREPVSGESEYAKARQMPHNVVPDFHEDGEYLALIGQSAELGFPRAMLKLGGYAMRRGAWVEAYYWMRRAQAAGVEGLATVLRDIRQNWEVAGMPDEAENVYELFSEEAGSIGRALLDMDSGFEVAEARKFLMAHAPKFLAEAAEESA